MRNAMTAPGGAPLLEWMTFTGLCGFGAVLLWHFGLVQRMVLADRTYISSVIALLYLGTSAHCLWRLVVVSREAASARGAAQIVVAGNGPLTLDGDAVAVEGGGALPRGLVSSHIRDLALKAQRQGNRPHDQTLLLRGLASRLRGSNAFGAFAGDTMMKLGLVGTIIGFIIMLAPIGTIDMANRGSVQLALSSMSEGMAIAMYTTLAGLVGSILVKIQYFLLENATAQLFTFALGLVEVHLVTGPLPTTDLGAFARMSAAPLPARER